MNVEQAIENYKKISSLFNHGSALGGYCSLVKQGILENTRDPKDLDICIYRSESEKNISCGIQNLRSKYQVVQEIDRNANADSSVSGNEFVSELFDPNKQEDVDKILEQAKEQKEKLIQLGINTSFGAILNNNPKFGLLAEVIAAMLENARIMFHNNLDQSTRFAMYQSLIAAFKTGIANNTEPEPFTMKSIFGETEYHYNFSIDFGYRRSLTHNGTLVCINKGVEVASILIGNYNANKLDLIEKSIESGENVQNKVMSLLDSNERLMIKNLKWKIWLGNADIISNKMIEIFNLITAVIDGRTRLLDLSPQEYEQVRIMMRILASTNIVVVSNGPSNDIRRFEAIREFVQTNPNEARSSNGIDSLNHLKSVVTYNRRSISSIRILFEMMKVSQDQGFKELSDLIFSDIIVLCSSSSFSGKINRMINPRAENEMDVIMDGLANSMYTYIKRKDVTYYALSLSELYRTRNELPEGGVRVDIFTCNKRDKVVIIDGVCYVTAYNILKAKKIYCENLMCSDATFNKHIDDLVKSYSKIKIKGVNDESTIRSLIERRNSYRKQECKGKEQEETKEPNNEVHISADSRAS